MGSSIRATGNNEQMARSLGNQYRYNEIIRIDD